MSELKTIKNNASASAFINKVKDRERREDAKKLLLIFKKATGMSPAMWGSSIVGYGSYRYKYASGREGDWMFTGFSPRKANLTVYVMAGAKSYGTLLKKLGPHKVSGGSCIYINHLDDIHLPTLSAIIKDSVRDMKRRYKTS